jgi:hypothetical protein
MISSKLFNTLFNTALVFGAAVALKPICDSKQPIGKSGLALLLVAVYIFERLVIR